MSKKRMILLGFVVLLFLLLFIIVDYKNKNEINGGVVSKNILYLTQPVYSFSGTVEKVEGSLVTVAQKITLPQVVIPQAPLTQNQSNGTPVYPAQKTVLIKYRVKVANNTLISQPTAIVNYYFKSNTFSQSPPTVKDIKIGQYITVTSQVDLRTLVGDSFQAVSINLPSINNVLTGKIASIKENAIVVRAFPPVGAFSTSILEGRVASPKEKEYTVKITSDTEISRYSYDFIMSPITNTLSIPALPKTEKLALTDLKKDMQVTVYTDRDVNQEDTFNALRIDPIKPPPIMQETPLATSSSQMIVPTP